MKFDGNELTEAGEEMRSDRYEMWELMNAPAF
jgi:hypothetical protein